MKIEKKIPFHYFFNILEHVYARALVCNSDSQILNKVKFVLYYFLIDAEKRTIELEKELAFYKYYTELENLRHQNSIFVNFNILGQAGSYTVIPLLFEPFVDNAMKHTKHDGNGWVDIMIDATNFPILNFCCKNNHAYSSSNIVPFKSGLKILEQRLEFYYKNNYALKIIQGDDLYEVALSINTI
ncbi:MAG: histidine kinase [Bacteroidetes bacterium]|nr:histidine kinase [Bacteroidota bacterium]MCL2302730.1 histidine kinase [Lentimicrobiaceae bacterium]